MSNPAVPPKLFRVIVPVELIPVRFCSALPLVSTVLPATCKPPSDRLRLAAPAPLFNSVRVWSLALFRSTVKPLVVFKVVFAAKLISPEADVSDKSLLPPLDRAKAPVPLNAPAVTDVKVGVALKLTLSVPPRLTLLLPLKLVPNDVLMLEF